MLVCFGMHPPSPFPPSSPPSSFQRPFWPMFGLYFFLPLLRHSPPPFPSMSGGVHHPLPLLLPIQHFLPFFAVAFLHQSPHIPPAPPSSSPSSSVPIFWPQMWSLLVSAPFLLLSSIIWPSISSQRVASYPEPKIWIAERHIGQQDFYQNRRALLPYEGEIIVGHEYTLVLEMSILERWDFLVESCACNQREGMFVERGGCLRQDGNWLAKQEFRRDQTKFMLIHFFAPEPLLRIQCQTRVVQCCGCCENFCERLMPPLDPYPSFSVPISCSYPIGLPPPVQPPPAPILAIPAAISPCWFPFLHDCPSSAIPHWLLILLICFLCLLPFLCLCCLLALCLLWGWGGRRFGERIWPSRKGNDVVVHPPPPFTPPVPSPPPATPQRIFVVDNSAQTNGTMPMMPPSSSPPAPSVPIPVPDYEERRGEQQRQRANEGRFEEHAALPLRDNWHPKLWTWTEHRVEEEIEEVEREEEEWRGMEESGGRKKEHRGGGGEHYENWNRVARRGGEGNGGIGWTRFGTEPPQGEEEDRFKWRTTSPDGTQREVDHHRVHWHQRSML